MQNTMQAFPVAAVSVSATATAAAAEAPDFDFQMPCRFFKSSFARSLSLNNNNNNVGGNGSIALTLAKKSPQIEAKQQPQQQQQQQQESPCSTTPPALPARRHTSNCNNNNNNALAHFNTAPPNQQQQQHLQQQQQQMQRNLNLAASWSMQDASHVAAPNNNSNNNCYNNMPQQQQTAAAAATTHEQTLNVEAVILQNQVDTLHWQLKQTETNCEMYRAVMEEVARFFERYQQQQLQQQQQQQQQQQLPTNRYSLGGVGEQISRSKSLHHVLQGVQSDPNGCPEDATGGSNSINNNNYSSANNSASYLRARSSTNVMLNKSMLTMNEEPSYESIAPAGSYNAFKDFTWRRSPKKLGGCKLRLSTAEAAEEKLNQEAFRLARTIRNLLLTSEQQPDLTQPRHSMGGCVGHRLGKNQLKSSSVLTLHAPPLHNSTSLLDANPGKNCNDNNNNNNNNSNAASSAEMLFLRSNAMRDSRLSLRSSTDSSVHSTISSTASSSSKIETDEEITPSNNNNNSSSNNNKQIKPAGNGSSTEDESGFSSISSFHDVGLPLSSTLIGGRLSLSTESRNSTLKSALNGVGVPLQPMQPLQPQQQHTPPQQPSQSPAKTYRNANRYQRFSTLSNEDAAAVLWV